MNQSYCYQVYNRKTRKWAIYRNSKKNCEEFNDRNSSLMASLSIDCPGEFDKINRTIKPGGAGYVDTIELVIGNAYKLIHASKNSNSSNTVFEDNGELNCKCHGYRTYNNVCQHILAVMITKSNQ